MRCRLALLVVLIATFTTGSGLATPLTFTWTGTGMGHLGGITGDPVIAPLTAAADGGFGGATILQDRSAFTITHLTVYGVSGYETTSYTFDLRTEAPVNVTATRAFLTLDGTVSTSNPDGIWFYANAWGASGHSPNPYGFLVYAFGGTAANVASGPFNAAWSQAAQFEGPVTTVGLQLTIAGLLPGDSVTFPSSIGLDTSVPENVPVPEPASMVLLGAGLLRLSGFWKRA